MNKRQKMICAIALFRNGYTLAEIAQALGVDRQRAEELKHKGAAAVRSGEIGYIQVSRISVDTTRLLDSTDGRDSHKDNQAVVFEYSPVSDLSGGY